MPTETEAVQSLQSLGLTEYESRCFVALSRVQRATAKEVSDLSEVPRSRVYDAVERLHRRGLVDIQQSKPRAFRAVSPSTALETLHDQYRTTLAESETALSNLETSDDIEESGAWAISEHDHVTDRVLAFLDEATDEAYLLITDENTLEPVMTEALAAASDRGVDVFVEVATEATRDSIAEAVPGAAVRTSELAVDPARLEGKWLGRIVMVDRHSVLVSGLVESARPGHPEETAIWASGPDHGLVVGFRHLLGDRVDRFDAATEN